MDMTMEDRSGTTTRGQIATTPHRFRELLHRLLFHANRGFNKLEFLQQSCCILLEFSGCDTVEVRLDERGKVIRCMVLQAGPGEIRIDCRAPVTVDGDNLTGHISIPERIIKSALSGGFAAAAPFFTRSGSFWTGDTAKPVLLREKGTSSAPPPVVIGGEFSSLALIPFPVDDDTGGIVSLGSRRREFFTVQDVHFYEAVAETLGVAIAHQGAQWALRERVKELTCLYGIARITQKPGISRDDLLREAAAILPPGWQYPDITVARIALDGKTHTTTGYGDSPYKQTSAIFVDGEARGTVEVAYTEARPELDEGPFLREERKLIDAVAESLGGALAHQDAQSALRERVKELTCLYGIAGVARRQGMATKDLLERIASLLPQAWQYPEITSARIKLDKESHDTPGFGPSAWCQNAPVSVGGEERGEVEVIYREEKPPADEGPFLKEERLLIDEVARQIGLILEQREAEEEHDRLQEQLLHADRLATIGQLAAGAAHELNEPLGSILGFTQLAQKCHGLPEQASRDMNKIVNAALHAREVIKKLLIFARQAPPKKSRVNLNRLVENGLYFLESRCGKEGVRLLRDLAPGLPAITADASQVHQVLVNLVVNALQAMPEGGTLTIRTAARQESVILTVEDTGTGMSDEVLKQIFMPFYTTKESGQGTGLGLAVVQGIVTSHGGSIHVESEPGRGSTFRVHWPVGEGSGPKEATRNGIP